MRTDAFPRLVALALAFFVTSCAVTGRQAADAANQALLQREAKTIRELRYPPLDVGLDVPADLDLQADVVADEGRRAYARGFSLPATGDVLSISVRSMRFGPASAPAIVYPDVRLLDERWQVVERIAPGRYRYRNTAEGPALTAEFFIDPAVGARYLLVTSSDVPESEATLVQSNATGAVPLMIPIGRVLATWMIPTGTSHAEARMAASPTGRIVVALAPYRLKTLDERPPTTAPAVAR